MAKASKISSEKKIHKKNTSSTVNESAVMYDKESINVAIIKEKKQKPEWQMTAVEKMEMMRQGVSKENLETLKVRTSLDYDKLSTLLSTTRATLINKKGKEQFSAALGERIISIADIYSYGYSVFEDVQSFRDWVFRPNQALGGKQPFDLLDNQFGREEIKNLIGRIDYGVYS
jgi:putative toxin-antitoxin system antitoxin component (TIGR02293 family)